MRKNFIYILMFLHTTLGFAKGVLKGVITDADNGEKIIGCHVIVQGTTLGAVSGIDGDFTIKNIPNGTHTVVFSYISYEKRSEKVTINNDAETQIQVSLKSASIQMKNVEVVGIRRTNTELAVITASRLSNSIANGISSQQISRSQDKDASEVIRRIPGVTIREGKFVVVRGLTERYNSVWLNNASTPSSESDVRAFSFDVIPSGQIDNILIYKTPTPELPADFAGAMVNIKTKSMVDKNSISFSYSYGYHQGTTGKDFFSYPGSKTDWLGFDKTTRVIPSAVPGTAAYKQLFDQTNDDKIGRINEISNSFNKIMVPEKKVAAPDADFQLSINRRFKMGGTSIGSISSFGYNSTNTTENSFRAGYLTYPDTAYRYNQNSFTSRVRVSALSNWVISTDKNNKIEFRNLFNNYGMNKTVLRDGVSDYSNGVKERSYELSYETRTTYSGQLAGNHLFDEENHKLDWVVGYSFANKKQPDIRRVKTTSDFDPSSQYYVNISNEVVVDALGRMHLNNEEHLINGAVNYFKKLKIGSFNPGIKSGLYYEYKKRTFSSRVFGYRKSPQSSFYGFPVESYNQDKPFQPSMFASLQSLFSDNIDYKSGMILAESTDNADSYKADNKLYAGYLAANLPISKIVSAYVGIRAENNSLSLSSFKRDGASATPVSTQIDALDLFPSINATFNLTDKVLFRLAGGKTINRPEFREISPFVFYNFEDNTTTYGNDTIKNCYIFNTDARIEWYPTATEIISLGVFYKDFKNPIEQKILYTGSGWNYTFDNAPKAKSYGIELDIRKTLHELEKSEHFSFLKNLTLILNASLIKSVIEADQTTERKKERELQGQSPYIINLGAYYQDQKARFSAGVMYNKAGKRLSTVGDKTTPHVYEMPFSSLDITLEKGISKWASVKLGLKNVLDDKIVFQQENQYELNGVSGSRTEIKQSFNPGMQIKLGINMFF